MPMKSFCVADYDKARELEKRAVITSNLDTEDDSNTARKRKKNHLYDSDDGDGLLCTI